MIIKKEKVGIVGIVTVRRHPVGTIAKLQELHRKGLHDEANALLARGEVATKSKNIVVQSANRGIDLLIQWMVSGLNSAVAYPIGPQWGEIGTGTTTPTLSDTALETPTLRAQLSYATDQGFNEAQLQFFFADGQLANGTYTEFGTFVSTSSTIGDGQLFNHVLFTTPYSKSSGNDSTVECDVTLANA